MILISARPPQIKSRKIMVMISVILFSLSFLGCAQAEPIPPKPHANIYVFDFAELIEIQDEQEMRKIAEILDKETKAQVVVVTVSDLSQMEIEEYVLNLFRTWGIGDREKNNGILILVNKESLLANKRGRIRIEVGYGLEGAINDGKAGAILDNFALPAFETGEYSRGIKDTFMAVASEVAREYGLNLQDGDLSGLEQYSVGEDDDLLLDLIIALIIFIVIIILVSRKIGGRPQHRRRHFNGPFGPFGGGGFGGGFGGGSFGGGSFGGFSGGSFGGGRSGGGGASR